MTESLARGRRGPGFSDKRDSLNTFPSGFPPSRPGPAAPFKLRYVFYTGLCRFHKLAHGIVIISGPGSHGAKLKLEF